jgi:mRNA interferase RelE/StbE
VELLVAPEAARSLLKIPRAKAEAIMARMRQIAANPYAPLSNVKPLKGEAQTFRLRVGDWRAIYHVDGQAVRVLLLRVAKREEAY